MSTATQVHANLATGTTIKAGRVAHVELVDEYIVFPKRDTLYDMICH